jgi:hypothetical protein
MISAPQVKELKLMEDIFRSYWWLLFPIGAFVFGAWDRWLAYKRSRDHLDLLRSYAEKGKEPPPELVRGVDPMNGEAPGGYGPGVPPPGYSPYDGYWGHPRYMRRAYRNYYRYGPYWQWRTVFITGAVAAGFWWASSDYGWPGEFGPFRLVAIIMTIVCAGNLVFALMASSFRNK